MSHDSRVAALDGLLEEAGLDAVLATKDASIAYLTGFWGLQLERFFGVVVKRGGDRRADRARRWTARASPPRRPASRRRSTARRVSNGLPELFATLDGAKRIGVEEDHLNFARSQALPRPATSSSPRPTWSCTCARPRTPRRSRPSGAPARTSRPPTTSCGRSWRSATPRPRSTRASRYLLARRGATHSEPHILFGAHAGVPHGSPGERTLEAGRRHRRRHRRPVRRLLGRPDPLRARRPAERLGGQGVGGRARGLRRRGRDDAARRARPRASTRPSATSSRPTRTSAPACTAPATRSAPRSTSRRSSSRPRTSRCARA